MKDQLYWDKRDRIKWGVLLHLAEDYEAERIVQLAFYRPSEFGQIEFDGQKRDLPAQVISHFRDFRTITSISSHPTVTVFDEEFKDRAQYIKSAVAFLSGFASERCIVFLDPDTGLQPKRPGLQHVLNKDVKKIWDSMKKGDVFVLYQHQAGRAQQDWKDMKRTQLVDALKPEQVVIKVAEGPEIAKDVVFYYMQNP